jgi:hypothetical protein
LATKLDTITEPRHGWSIPEWGKLYGFGRAKSYAIIRKGQGPRVVPVGGGRASADTVGGSLIITVDADREWRANGCRPVTSKPEKVPA